MKRIVSDTDDEATPIQANLKITVKQELTKNTQPISKKKHSNAVNKSNVILKKRKVRKVEEEEEDSDHNDNHEDDPQSDHNDEDEDEPAKQVVISRKGQRDRKAQLIARILSRWWYVLPEWPPPDFDYEQALKEKRLKLVALNDWEAADDIDQNGLMKVYGLTHFKGVYRDPQGRAIDLRPTANKPCYSTFKHRSEIELYGYLITALKNQIKSLNESTYWNTEGTQLEKLRTELEQELINAERDFKHASVE